MDDKCHRLIDARPLSRLGKVGGEGAAKWRIHGATLRRNNGFTELRADGVKEIKQSSGGRVFPGINFVDFCHNSTELNQALLCARCSKSCLHYCNILYEMMPIILGASHLRAEMDAKKLAAIAMVAAGYAGDMDEELCNELLDDMDFHYNKVKCRKIEGMLPKLMKMVEGEMRSMR